MRRRRAPKREILPDPKYNNPVVSKFINIIMLKGKKTVAQRIVYRCFDIIKERLNEQDVLKVFNKAIENVRPHLEVKPRRIGGATYQVPVEVKPERGISLALRWIRDFARAKKGKPMEERLAEELISAYKGEGSSVKKKEDTHKMAEANRAFVHFRW
ncbi:MAG: 30S ribosomal protein S7 [Candidatus Omnitrophica bacterium]|nr:30S ribosomal protein S7 [Candidatus Omnitrophota bacterium]MCM8800214.1 30S ribosomal protein S7 [Candidatus Omnitrophota bacterium]